MEPLSNEKLLDAMQEVAVWFRVSETVDDGPVKARFWEWIKSDEAKERCGPSIDYLMQAGKFEELTWRLLPCPYCGGKSHEEDQKTPTVFLGGPARTPGFFKVECYGCNASVERGTMEGVVAAWNKRR